VIFYLYFVPIAHIMKSIKTPNSMVHFSDIAIEKMNVHLSKTDYSNVFIIVDENTHEHCLPLFLPKVETDAAIEIIELESGEENKNIETCTQVWSVLSELGADRKSLMINLGGGVLTDMGGFIAATFKRGIQFINVPTTLLSMVDASVGGKTGIDLGALKNQIGVIVEPEMVLILPEFLNTLEERQLRSGFAEMLKHGLIQDPAYWEILSKTNHYRDLSALIKTSVEIKAAVVIEDPTEQHKRKVLNFGHTLGHAIESYCLENNDIKTLLHGEAIAIGMILEAFVSYKTSGLALDAVLEIKKVFNAHFSKVHFIDKDINQCLDYLKFDKKNSHGKIKFALLSKIGNPVIDVLVPEEIIREAFVFYLND
jgi:3-dehydroquinate synthase